MNFTHLHIHSDYSFLDGFAKLEDIFAKAKELGMESLAITEHGNMCSVVKASKLAKEYGIKYIVGQEFYIVDRKWIPHDDKVSDDEILKNAKREDARHIVLLAKNETGYKNLIKLSTIANTEYFYYNPRISLSLLKKYSSGIICLTACLNGILSKSFRKNEKNEALQIANELKRIFSNDLYIEIQTNNQDEQIAINRQLLELAKELKIKSVLTTDVHYISKEDYKFHDAWLCIKTEKIVSDQDRLHYTPNDYYLLSEEELPKEFFKYAKTAKEIADKCTFVLNLDGKLKFPKSGIDNPNEYLKNTCNERLSNFSNSLKKDFKEYRERLDIELSVIEKLGFADYFIIIEDLIKYCKKTKGIMVGPGRGSGVGSLVCFLLGITEIDPLEFGLIFERFLHEGRISPPDLDLDFQQDRRDEVISYIKERWGYDKVSEICNFSMLQPKQALKDAMRILGIEYSIADSISKLVPDRVLHVEDLIELSPEFEAKVKTNKLIEEAVKLAQKFQGHIRQAGTHASGIVISPVPLNEIVPLQKTGGKVATQFDMHDIEDLGLLKIDILGLRTLTIIDKAIKGINKSVEKFEQHPSWAIGDKEVYKMLSRGETQGCFMLETPLMTQACLDFGIESFEDIVMIGAICRPVTLENGMYGVCLHNRLHPDEIEYKHPLLGDILNNTHGIVLYQEHVMDICRKLANFSYKEADTIRALIGKGASLDEKKKEKLLADSKKKFFNGCKENKISKELTEELWGLIGNASYGFNKAHATSYALISYRTAWLKRYYPAYFMAAVLTTVSNDLDRISEYMSLCKSLGIKIIKPNILAATKEFGVEERNIKFGFSAIKGIGDKTAELIESISGKLTKNSDLYDVLTLLEKACKKQIIVALIKSGALDSIIENRRMIIENIDLILKKYRSGKKKNINQEELFQMKHVLDIPKLEEYSTTELLAHEYETTGLFLTSDFLAKHRETFVNYCVSSISQLESLKDKTSVKFGGIIISVSEFTTKRQQKMAKFGIESLIGNINFVCFPNQWEKFKEIVSIGNPVIIIADSNEGRNEWIIREMRKL